MLLKRPGNLNAHREFASGRGLTVDADDNVSVLLGQDYQANAFDGEFWEEILKFFQNEFLYVRFMHGTLHHIPRTSKV